MPYKADAPAWCLVCGGRAVATGRALDSRAAVGYCAIDPDTRTPCKAPVLVTFDPAAGRAAEGRRLIRVATARHARHDPAKPHPHCAKCTPDPTSSGRLIIGNPDAGKRPARAATGRSL